MKNKKLVFFAVLLLVLGMLVSACSPITPTPTVTPRTAAPEIERQSTDGMEDKAAPDFTLKGFDEQDHTLSQYYDTVVVLNFWAVGCPPCVSEMPDLNEINNLDYVTVITVAPDGILGNEFNNSKGFIEKFNTVALWDADRATNDLYPSQYFPHTYVIDRSGTIRYSIRGGTNYDELKEKVDRVNELG